MKRTYRHIIMSIMLATIAATPSHAMAPPTPHPGTIQHPHRTDHEHPDLILLRQQMQDNHDLPPLSFWLAVARCETAHGLNGRNQWRRGYNWKTTTVTGAMGIATSAWLAYGGDQFAPRAARASKWAQIIVANRIGFLGWQTSEYRTWEDRVNNRPMFRNPAGFSQGWGGTCRTQWVKDNG